MKLGLALSGGGFRASLFHIGVLARLAELDLVGKVEVLSTVSGGSIVGALYYLMLKDLLETPAQPPPAPPAAAPLTAADFVALVARLEETFLAGVQRNPRTRVVTNPIQNLRMALTDYSRTERMGLLYNRFFYREVWEQCTGQYREAVPLRDIKITPPWCPSRDAYNAAHPYKIPMLIINATTMNTGMNWRFTANEVGDPDLGFIRFDEVSRLVALRRWLTDRTRPLPHGFTAETARFAAGVAAGRLIQGGALGVMLLGLGGGGLPTLPLRTLYELKSVAWAAAAGPPADRKEAVAEFDNRLQIVGAQPSLLRSLLPLFGLASEDLFDLLYLARMADRVTDACDRDLEELSLEKAVGASAAVPGIFQPLIFRTIYDDRVVEAVSLVDGGVFDNQGLTALFEEECTHIICSDASGQLVFQHNASGKVFGVLPRVNDVLMEKIRRDEMELLADRVQVEERALFHLKSAFDPTPGGMPALPWLQEIAEVRTDLDSFSDREAFALMYHGYYLAAHAVTRETFPSCIPGPVPETPERWRFNAIQPLLTSLGLQHHLAVGASRLLKIFRLWSLQGLLAWLLAGVMLLAGWVWIPPVTLNEIWVWPLELFQISEPITVGFFVPFADKLADLLPQLKPLLEFSVIPLGDLFDLSFHLPFLAFVAGAALLAWSLWERFKALLLRRDLEGLWILISLVSKYKRLPLAPLAVVWGAVAAVVAWVYLLTFDKLFLKAGRL